MNWAKLYLFYLIGIRILGINQTHEIKIIKWGNKWYASIEDHGLSLIPENKLNHFKRC